MGKGALAALDSYPAQNYVRRAYNFCAGPAMLDSDVMIKLHCDFLSFQGSGMSLLEMSQRDKEGPVQQLISSATSNLKQLLHIPETHTVLLFQGGAHGQFAAVPMNLCKSENDLAQYVNGGFWSERAANEASKYARVDFAASTQRDPQTGELHYPDSSEWNIDPEAAYVHIVTNETIDGVEMDDPDLPAGTVLVSDMTSTLLSRPVDVSKYGVIYASGGKNLGPAGVCVVIVRKDLLERASPRVPSILSWKTMRDHDNLYNTQCTFAIWAMKTATDQLLARGGLRANQARVQERAKRVYDAIDSSHGFYTNRVAARFRSRTTVPFRIRGGDAALEDRFSQEAKQVGLHQLGGHHTCGGLRVCIYNGIPDEGLEVLLCFMQTFQAQFGGR